MAINKANRMHVTDLTVSEKRAQDYDSNCHPSVAVIEAVADTAGIDALDLPPLYEVIDSDALDRLVQSTDHQARVKFDYVGLTVTVHGDGQISVTSSNKS